MKELLAIELNEKYEGKRLFKFIINKNILRKKYEVVLVRKGFFSLVKGNLEVTYTYQGVEVLLDGKLLWEEPVDFTEKVYLGAFLKKFFTSMVNFN